jgi:transcription antitermination factor NusG
VRLALSEAGSADGGRSVKSWGNTSQLSEEGEALSTISGPIPVSSAFPDGLATEAVTKPALLSRWFAVYTTPRHEKAVARQFEVRQLEAFLPLHRSVHRWKNGCRVSVDQPLFPNYVFVSLQRGDYIQVLQTPGVLSLVGRGREPAPLPAAEIESLRSGLPLRDFEPHPYLVAGRRVRIHSGALAGMVGVLVRKKNSLRVVLTLDLIMQSVSVEIGVDEIEPVRV